MEGGSESARLSHDADFVVLRRQLKAMATAQRDLEARVQTLEASYQNVRSDLFAARSNDERFEGAIDYLLSSLADGR